MSDSISLIIPAKNIDTQLQLCLQSVAECVPAPLELIVVIDGYQGPVAPWLEQNTSRVIRLPESVGPGVARNIGAKEASGDILLFIDADVTLQSDICLKIDKAFDQKPQPDAVFGSYNDQPLVQDTISLYKNLLHHYTHQHAGRDAFTFWTGCGAILKKRFIELDGFSTDYKQPSIEDIELGYRLKRIGGNILLDHSLQVTHLKKWSFSGFIYTDFFLRAIPWSSLILQYGAMHNDLNINMKNRLSVICCMLMPFLFFLNIVSLQFIWLSIVAFMLLLLINRQIFILFIEKRGLFFTLQTIPLHILHYLLGGLAFSLVFIHYTFGRMMGQRASSSSK